MYIYIIKAKQHNSLNNIFMSIGLKANAAFNSIIGINTYNINFKHFFINKNKILLKVSNKQIIDKNINSDATLEKSKKNLKNIKFAFLYFLKLIKKNLLTKNNIFLVKNKNFIFYFNAMFFLKNLLKELQISYFLFNFVVNKNNRFKKLKSIKKRLKKKNVTSIKIY